MRFLDLDLDFFLNSNTYGCRSGIGRPGSEYKPWSISRVRGFLENRCGLSPCFPIEGRTVKSHEGVLRFWRALVTSGKLTVPFEVIHIDAHPDLLISNGLYLKSGFLRVSPEKMTLLLKKRQVHSGNYLTFAIAYGWISALIWIPLLNRSRNVPQREANAATCPKQKQEQKNAGTSDSNLSIGDKEYGIPFRVLPWTAYKSGKFDFIALSRSPDFTPPESDRLVGIIEEYIKKI